MLATAKIDRSDVVHDGMNRTPGVHVPHGGASIEGSYDRAMPDIKNSTQGHQGRIASLRAELLPPLPAGGASRGAGRHVHKSCGLPIHQAKGLMFHITGG